ncbi:putative phytosulfokines 6 [Sesamum indicum]|uniref:Phytosulfokine n=1 Tax=Sesamum indicum TaxID=4182 RepID=A0A6I9UPL9_SESIN|nr:putative phytosulfokines 6 [Sesamum indicum]
MKHLHLSQLPIIISLFLLLLLLFIVSAHQSESAHTPDQITLQDDDLSSVRSFEKLMGLEECGDKDEGCWKRRMVAEAHLDYIYTQHHQP